MTTIRRQWTDLPISLRDAVEKKLGSSIVQFLPTLGGFSIGSVAGIAQGSNNESLFIKAVPTYHVFVVDYRREARILAGLPPEVSAPRLRLFLDEEGWVLLASDAVIGRIPHEPWQDEELAAALSSLTSTSSALTPSPITDTPTVAERLAGRCETYRALSVHGRLGAIELGDLSQWELDHLVELAALESRWQSGTAGNTLIHFDLRYDNCMIGESGSLVFVDWGRACLGKPWIDLVCLLVESDLGDRDPEAIFMSHPLGATADQPSVTAFLVALASYWTHAASLPPLHGAPSLRARQEYSRQATVAWLQRRWLE